MAWLYEEGCNLETLFLDRLYLTDDPFNFRLVTSSLLCFTKVCDRFASSCLSPVIVRYFCCGRMGKLSLVELSRDEC